MEVTAESPVRGSEKLFAIKGNDQAALLEALGAARGKFEVKWWWKYGQPRIDRILAEMTVPRDQVGSAISDLMLLNGQDVQVIVSCFPNGLPHPDMFRVEASFQRNV